MRFCITGPGEWLSRCDSEGGAKKPRARSTLGSAGRAEGAEAGSKDRRTGRKYLQHISQIQVAVSNM